jgi:hypothetical protein
MSICLSLYPVLAIYKKGESILIIDYHRDKEKEFSFTYKTPVVKVLLL